MMSFKPLEVMKEEEEGVPVDVRIGIQQRQHGRQT